MSHITPLTLQFKNPTLLALALQEALGLTAEEVEVHKEPVSLPNFYGQTDGRMAHVVIRKTALNRVTGQGYADVGFLIGKEDMTFTYDHMDTKLANSVGKLKASYSQAVILDQARKKGFHAERTVVNGKPQIRVRVR